MLVCCLLAFTGCGENTALESGGNITPVDVFPNGQLAGVMAVMDEHLLIAAIPWTFNNYKEAREIIDTTGGEYYKKILAQQGMTFLASAHNGFRQITNGKHAVIKPEDVAGLKIRVPGGEVYFKFRRAFGADPVAMSRSEAFTAIQQGTIDGQENGFSVTNSAKVNEIQQYMTVWNYTYENYLFVANTKIFENLEPKTQELIRAKAKEACEWGRDLVENDEEKIKEKFIKGGMEVVTLTPEQLKPFQYKIQGVRKELMEKYGDEACKAFRMK